MIEIKNLIGVGARYKNEMQWIANFLGTRKRTLKNFSETKFVDRGEEA